MKKKIKRIEKTKKDISKELCPYFNKNHEHIFPHTQVKNTLQICCPNCKETKKRKLKPIVSFMHASDQGDIQATSFECKTCKTEFVINGMSALGALQYGK